MPTRPAERDIDLYSASLDRAPGELAALASLLSVDEHARAARFRFDRDRNRYIAGRGLVRLVLARHLGTSARELAFVYGEFDKPHLRGGGVHFNLSHSGALALLAVTHVAEVGVDLERQPAGFDVAPVARRFFSPTEVCALERLAPDARDHAFLLCWTRKEAFIKARGDGLQLALDSFDVSLDPDLPAVLQRTAWDEKEPGQWTIRDVSDPEQGYVGAVAIRATDVRVVCHRVPGSLTQWLTTMEDR